MTKSIKMLSLNQDSFIYAVHQAFEARQIRPGGEPFNSHLRYEPFLSGKWTPPSLEALDFSTFKHTLSEIITHHYNILPNYQKHEQVTVENISWFAHSVATLLADIEYLFRSYVGTGLPLFAENTLPKTAQSQDKSEEITKEVWSLVVSLARKIFGSYFELISTYVLWKYSPREKETEVLDWNVRPPCGAAYRKQFKEYIDAERDEKRSQFNAKKREGNDRRFDTKKHEGAAAPHHSEVQKTEKIEKSEKIETPPQNAPFLKREAVRDRFPHKKGEVQPRKNDFDMEHYKQKNLEDALLEAKQAVQRMQDNHEVREVNLKPQNSFIRREQHVVLAEAGFDTESRGETSERHVCAKRKN